MVSYYIYAGLHYMFMSRVCKEKKVENPFNASVIIVMTIVFSVLIMCPALFYRVVLLRYSHSGSSLYNLFVVGNKK